MGRVADPDREKEYETAQADARADFQTYARQLHNGEITSDEFKKKMRQRLKEFYLAIALIGSRGNFDVADEKDTTDLRILLGGTYELLDDFVQKVDSNPGISENAIVWQAGIYSFARATYTRYTVDEEIFHLLPVFPGVDCLGDGACGCSLEVIDTGDGIAVNWFVDPFKENCVVCLSAAADSPYYFSYDEVGR